MLRLNLLEQEHGFLRCAVQLTTQQSVKVTTILGLGPSILFFGHSDSVLICSLATWVLFCVVVYEFT